MRNVLRTFIMLHCLQKVMPAMVLIVYEGVGYCGGKNGSKETCLRSRETFDRKYLMYISIRSGGRKWEAGNIYLNTKIHTYTGGVSQRRIHPCHYPLADAPSSTIYVEGRIPVTNSHLKKPYSILSLRAGGINRPGFFEIPMCEGQQGFL